jgi:hypothetical protein
MIQILTDHQFNPTIRLVSAMPSQAVAPAYITQFDHSIYRLPMKLGTFANPGETKGQYGRKFRDKGAGNMGGSVSGDSYRRGYDYSGAQAGLQGMNNMHGIQGSGHRGHKKIHGGSSTAQMSLTAGGGSNSARSYNASSRSSSFSDYGTVPATNEHAYLESMYLASGDPQQYNPLTHLSPLPPGGIAYAYPGQGTYQPVSPMAPSMTQASSAPMQILQLPAAAGNGVAINQHGQYQYVSAGQLPVYYYAQQPANQQHPHGGYYDADYTTPPES